MADRVLFGTDGVRGLANEMLTPELALEIAMAAAAVLPATPERLVLIGKDTRQSGDMLEAAMAAGFASAGCQVKLLGVVPTPAVAWLVQAQGAMLGAMISASHNPAPDNGIKLFAASGSKLSDDQEFELEKRIRQRSWQRCTGAAVGRIQYQVEASEIEPYLAHILSLSTHDLSSLKLAIDIGHGAMVYLAPALFERLGMQVQILNTQPDGMNINENCGSTHLEPLKEVVRSQGLDLGIAFDGDGDRCLAVGPQGQEIDGDRILYWCSQYLPAYREQKTVVATVMSNLGLEKALEKSGKRLLRTGVGDRYVLEAMSNGKHTIGGEQSGHVIFADQQVTGDGLLTAVNLLNALQASGKSVSDLLAEFTPYPQVLKNVRVQDRWHHTWMDHQQLRTAIKKVEQELGQTGRLLVRASGTEPKIRVMAEGPDAEQIDRCVDQLVDLIQAEMG